MNSFQFLKGCLIMINNIVLISEKDKQKYLENIQVMIDQFSRDVQKITESFNDLHVDVPISAYANFRDALFHFLKIRSLGDEIQVLKEMYAIEEHLHRSLKDTVISLFQNITIRLEKLLEIEYFDNKELYTKMDDKTRDILKRIGEFNTKEEFEAKFKDLREVEIDRISLALLYFYINEVKPDYKRKYRKIIHNIKNECIKIRNVSLSIDRPLGDQKNTAYYCDFYKTIKKELEDMNIFMYVPFAYQLNSTFTKHLCNKEKQKII